MLQAPTGFGKTLTAAWIIQRALDKGKRVIFTVPAIELVDQTAREFFDEGIRDIGVMQADHPMTDASRPVQIATVQTLQRRALPPADLVLIDEAHKLDSFVKDWMSRDEWLGVPFIGLSATPWTKGLGRFFDRLIIAATTQDLIDRGFLSPFRVFAPSHPDLQGVRTVAGDYRDDDLSAAMNKKELTADIARTWLERGEQRPTLCFAVDRAHAREIQASFARVGVEAGYVDGNTPREERDAVAKAFASGEIKVVCNVGVLTTGVDWDVRCIILARPTKSEILYTQIVGRGLRTAPGKDHCLILDHSDTTLRLGFVTDIRHQTLDDGTPASKQKTREREEPKPRECPKCQRLVQPRVFVCPSCGFKPARQSEVTTRAGELIELDGRRQRKDNRDAPWDQKIAFMGELKTFASKTGKSSGWVSHKYRERYGVWPNDQRLQRAVPAALVSPQTYTWIQSRNIAYAKRRSA
jgi:superfamily II DNA or RNA helicase